ncbi:hypothetical protein [Leifsonia sp. Root112D2]|uniref:hypothetical protein n=1 Tax=Leifsonia sp. Root112D2 TaxID=1736426 RepID=UPI0007008A34|nr:hypothetical protein [Leifsonia sp. Root112D2]KQV06729.1 hypothetical protein ASC63_04870 [Leifsonia sp. Root112D2]
MESPDEIAARLPDALDRFAAAAGLRLSRVQLWAHPPVGEPDDVCLIAELSLSESGTRRTT